MKTKLPKWMIGVCTCMSAVILTQFCCSFYIAKEVWVFSSGLFRKVDYVTGRDTVCFVGNAKYQIYKAGDGLYLGFQDDMKLLCNIVYPVHNYEKRGNVLYVKGLNGIAIIDGKDNSCRLMLYGEPKEKYEEVTYLDSYYDFTPKERKMFERMG